MASPSPDTSDSKTGSAHLTTTAFWQYDDEQAVDLFIHDLYY